MALTVSVIHRFCADNLLRLCSEEGFGSEGPVLLLRQRLVRHLKASTMARKHDVDSNQESVPTDLSSDMIRAEPQCFNNSSHVGGSDNSLSVFVELLRQVPSLSSEEHEAILRFVSRLDCQMSDDRIFVIRTLPLVSGAVLRFFGDCLRNGRNWDQCKTELLKEFFAHFVRERMIGDHIIFSFHEVGQSLC